MSIILLIFIGDSHQPTRYNFCWLADRLCILKTLDLIYKNGDASFKLTGFCILKTLDLIYKMGPKKSRKNVRKVEVYQTHLKSLSWETDLLTFRGEKDRTDGEGKDRETTEG